MTILFLLPVQVLTVPAFSAVQDSVRKITPVLPDVAAFNKTIDGRPVSLFYLKNKRGTSAAITNYGARLVALLLRPKNGKLINVVAGYDGIDGYLNSTAPYYGATVGRYANRISKGKFTLNGQAYQTTINNGPNTLHGGKKGFNAVVWEARQISWNKVDLSYVSNDGEEGFPGTVKVTVSYTLTDANALMINYSATTDKATVINLTNHSFFNLNGIGNGDILKHTLQVNAAKYTPVDPVSIPTGEELAVKGTPFDFLHPKTIGSDINDTDAQLNIGKGYDINFMLNQPTEAMPFAAKAVGNLSGIIMEVFTTQPGLQFFSGNFMQGKNLLDGNIKDSYRTAFCLETQHFPDAPNQPKFSSTVLMPGKVFKSSTTYQFIY